MNRRLFALVTVCLIALLTFAQNTELPMMQPEALAKVLESGGEKPTLLYVGPHLFYTQAHIPGAAYIGPAAKPEGMEKLRAWAKSQPHGSLVVIYCGCCPFDHCPNISPAYSELKTMGFTNLRVLYLGTSFGTNWVDRGYPVAKGE
ncbi:MAG TPA: rhodanese-like domain-containing protein [Terriglobia bacterium]|nr:rhodanese-like domain-containing protein [Terriglobia bacterium]